MKSNSFKAPFLDFFAGSGLVSEGLKSFFFPVWANDLCTKKASVFLANHPKEVFQLGPIESVNGKELPYACLSWGSFPCQDLSLAGNIKGLSSPRSGLFWQWLRVMDEMPKRPPIVVAENVVGLISAAKGSYYRKIHEALVERGYKVGALVIDAAFWVPQSRKRVFVVAFDKKIPTDALENGTPIWCHSDSVVRVARDLADWVWWSLPLPRVKRKHIEEIIDFNVPFDENLKNSHLVSLIPETHRKKILESIEKGQNVFPGYKRIRQGRQVLELRFDGMAGCLRTPSGGSSRQFVVIFRNGSLNTRLLTVKEAALLMGVRKNYIIPGSYNDGYKAMGDAVAVPVTRYLATHLLSRLSGLAWEDKS